MSSVKIHGDPKTEKKEMRRALIALAAFLMWTLILYPWVWGAWLEPMIFDPWKTGL